MKRVLIIICFFISVAKAQLLNGGMESYTITSNDTIPSDWRTETVWSSIPGRTTDAHSGNYAFIINTWYHYSMGTLLNGKFMAMDFWNEWIKGGTPINYKPQSLVGFYKYTNVVAGDSAIAKVALKKWNSTKGRADTVCFGLKKLPAVSAYTGFTVDIFTLIPSVQPDSIVVCFHSFDGLAGQTPCVDAYCRYLYLDDLSLQGVSGINEISKDAGVSSYLNDGKLYVKNKEGISYTADIITVEGKKIQHFESKEKEKMVEISDLPKGIYFLSLTSTKGTSNTKFVFGR